MSRLSVFSLVELSQDRFGFTTAKPVAKHWEKDFAKTEMWFQDESQLPFNLNEKDFKELSGGWAIRKKVGTDTLDMILCLYNGIEI